MHSDKMPNIDIDELLNSFLDGELDQRHQTEVQRMIKHDERIAERLQKIKKCRRLVSSLPYAEAPEGMLENIKAALKEQQLPAQPYPVRRFDEQKGAKHLLLRRLTAAAAMIGLVAVLGVVVYSIIAPEDAADERFPLGWQQPRAESQMQKRGPDVTVATAEKPAGLAEIKFSGRLELKTSSPSEVIAFINKAIENNIPSDERAVTVAAGPRDSHTLTCSRQNLRSLLTDLGSVWDKFDSATLFVETDRPEEKIVVDEVAVEQVIEIVNQNDSETQVKAAKYFAALNNMAELMPGKEALAAVDIEKPDLITIPKPVLTSSEKTIKKPTAQREDSRKVHLIIVVVGDE